jgi:lysophospholipid acyltransferase 1/2
MVYLCALHLYGQLKDFGNYTLDITSPMMITTQKLTSLVFSYRDGMRNEDSLTKEQKKQAIK